MRLAMIGTRGVPARYGGFETAIEEIGTRLAVKGHEVVVFCRPLPGQDTPHTYQGMKLVWLPAMRSRTLETLTHTAVSVFRPVGHLDAAFMFNAANSIFLPVLRARGIPVATHVDGLEWRRDKWGLGGLLYYRTAEALAVRWSDALIADAQGIADYYAEEFGAPTEQIAYGAPILTDPADDGLAEFGLCYKQYHLVVARFEPENHILEIVRGFVRSHAKYPLVVVGSAPYSDAYTRAVRRAADGRVRLLGAVWDQDQLNQLYAHSLTYLHGHSVGGTNPSLLRAAGAGAAIVAYDVSFNREVLGPHGRFFRNELDVARWVDAAEADPRPAREAGIALRRDISRYNWDDVAEKYERLAEKLATGQTPRPRPSGRRIGVGSASQRPPVLIAHPSPDLYGSDRMLLESASGLIAAPMEVTVALPSDGPLVRAMQQRGAMVVKSEAPVLRKAALRPAGFVRLVRDAVTSIAPTLRTMQRAGTRTVYVNTITIPTWTVLGRLSGRKVLVHVHEAEASQPVWVRRLLYASLLLADRIVVNSQFSLDVLAQSWPRLRRVSTVVYNGVPGPPDPPELPRPDVSDGVRLLFLGRLSQRKGPDVAIRALKVLADRGVPARLSLLGAVFPGYEWYLDELHAFVAELGLTDSVTFLGFDPDIWRRVAEHDIVVVPSVVDEPFGNTAIEALLAQRPLVVSATSGLKEAAQGFEAARFVPPKQPDAVAEAVVDLAGHWQEVREQVRADRASALSRYSPEAYGKAIAAEVVAVNESGRRHFVSLPRRTGRR